MDEKADRKKIFRRYAGYIAGTLGIGSLSALLSRGGMEAFSYLKKPAFALNRTILFGQHKKPPV